MTQPRIAQTEPPPGFIDLGSGNPGLKLMPLDMLRRAADQYFADAEPRTLQYGAEEGNGYFLAALADFLSSHTANPVQPGSLLATAGASSALDLLCTLFTRPGDVVFVEEPTYFLALRVFRDHDLRMVPVPMDEGGLAVDVLQEKLKEHEPAFLYTIPTYHNPASLTLSRSRRDQLVELADRHDFLLLADEVYHLLDYAGAPPRPFAAYADDAAQVISINSFSKILAPGLRLGWIQAHEAVIQRLAGCGQLDSGGGMNPFTSAVVRYLIESGDLGDNIGGLKETYHQRLQAMAAALEGHLPGAEYRMPEGGFFFWVRLPGVDAAAFRQRAREREVDFRPGVLFSSERGLGEYLRLSFSYYDAEDIEQGVKRLGEALP